MKDKRLRLLLGVLVLAVLPLAMTACVITAEPNWPVVWVGPDHHEPLHEYTYYPDVNVYFDPIPGLYFWFDGGRWSSGHGLPHGYALRGRGERFRSDAHSPWEVHDRVAPRFHGQARPMERAGRPMERAPRGDMRRR